ncbi:flagellar biosynthesis protein FlgB [Rhodobacter veldkampii DSM 11550]|uniref:Flagellar biosynthesis protein FlgB n=1 Tax=Phaeovulum veldkampii DSM 11550 TaxID=1185920 RepID=A0A2T4JLE5_9RHOB|nr:FlgB family protein [Phaeovulum veldkampii]MBK5946559.1 flagellar biosynthesis protein FlgB [Phaeovulum veldkampii DSM 11550]PTE18750.1 flagellar biosynthesis protein FlgB [Phaeovulum veldkampii DSM 11550]TDQ60038.1 flagellar basal-body rod protein FlgB [Phaeovulum veldkampii DSM 11550]
MFDQPEVMRTAQAMASHAALRQNAVARNMANADTPGYASRDVAPFDETYRAAFGGDLRATRAGHIGASGTFTAEVRERDAPGTRSPNGNSVSIESEMVKSVEVKRQHDLALAIYKSSLNILRSSLGRG